MQSDYVLWIATALYAAHVLEEHVHEWKGWASSAPGLPVNWTDFHLADAVVIVLGICCAMVGGRLPDFGLIYPAPMKG